MFRKAHVIMGVKVALGAAAAIGLAMLLRLEFTATAGIITVLSIMGTKRETLRIARGRLLAFVTGMGIACVSYSLLGYGLAGFTAYLFVFAVVCYACRWGYAVPMGLLCAFVFKLPEMWVYFILCLDEFVKLPVNFWYYRKRRWLKNITRD